MAGQTALSGLMAKLGARINKGLAANAAKPIEFGRGGGLPGGIVNGVAQLDKIEFGQNGPEKKNPGAYYCQMTAIVMEPEWVEENGQRVKVRGMQTRYFEQIADTTDAAGKNPMSVEEHADRLANLMRAVMYARTGGEFDASNLEEAAQAMEAAAPFFSFSTRSSPEVLETVGPNAGKVKYAARVWETWIGSKGIDPDYQPPEPEGGGVRDEGTPSPNGQGKALAKPAAAKAPQQPVKADVDEAEQEEEPVAEEEEQPADYQLMELVEAASSAEKTKERQAAREELVRLAKEAGWSDEEVEEAADWQATADMVSSPKEAEAEGGEPVEEPEAEPEPEPPTKGKACSYQRVDAKGMPLKGKDKKILRPVSCVVQSVNAKDETCTLLLLEDKKTQFKGVSFADVLPPE